MYVCVCVCILRQHIKQGIVYVIDSQAVVAYWTERIRFNKPIQIFYKIDTNTAPKWAYVWVYFTQIESKSVIFGVHGASECVRQREQKVEKKEKER